jgi:hypothetical protein
VGVGSVLVNFLSTTIWIGARVIDRERRIPLGAMSRCLRMVGIVRDVIDQEQTLNRLVVR